jgi:hypothetical protein
MPLYPKPLRLARPPSLPDRISDETFREAVQAWLRGKDSQTAADILGVPRATVLRLVGTPEWGRMAATYRKEVAEVEAGVLSHLAHKALRQLGERLILGDEHVLKDGSKVYKAVPAVDLARIASSLMDRRAQALRVVDGREEKTDDSMAELFEIANRLKRFSAAKEINAIPAPADPPENAVDVVELAQDD